MRSAVWILALSMMLCCAFQAVAKKDDLHTNTNANNGKPLLGLYGGAGQQSYQKALEQGIDYLFISVHWYEDNDWMKDRVQQAHTDGLKVCPSFATAVDGVGENLSEFAKLHPEWLEMRRDGTPTNQGEQVGLSFGVPEVRKHKVEMFAKRVREYNLDGILLDYTRMFDRNCGYHPSIVEAYRSKTGRDAFQISNDDPNWIRFRADYVTTFVRELREKLDAIGVERGRPVELLACVNPDPQERLMNVMQDWKTWVDEGLVQGVVTMVYDHDPNESIEKVRIANEACGEKVWHMPMIAPYDWYLTTDELLIDASLKCLKTGCIGLAFYRDDYIFKYDLWDAIAEVTQWTRNQIKSMPVNYVRNPGFELAMESWADGGTSQVHRVESPNLVRSGEASAHLLGKAQLRQVISTGLPEHASSLVISFWVKSNTEIDKLPFYLDVCTNEGRGKETYYRVPIKLLGDNDWQRIEAVVPLDTSLVLNHLLFGFISELSTADILLDDVSVHVSEQPVDSSVEDFSISSRQASNNWNIMEDNLLRGQAVTGSSFWEVGTEFDNAVDGDLSTENYGYGAVWVSQRPAIDQWIQIHLPAKKLISRIRILNNSSQSAYRTNTYKVELSPDGRRFRKVAEGSLPDEGTTWTEIEFRPFAAKYVRFTGITGFNLDYAVGIQEIEAYSPHP